MARLTLVAVVATPHEVALVQVLRVAPLQQRHLVYSDDREDASSGMQEFQFLREA